MAGPLVYDRVKETTAVTGTGSATLLGAQTGYQSFNTSALGTGNTTYYCIADQGGPNWEVGVGTFTSPSTLARTTVLASSNAGSAVTFTTGTKDVFIVFPAAGNYIANPITIADQVSETVSNPALTVTQTWNNVATTFEGIVFNIINSASATGSRLFDVQAGGVTQFWIEPTYGIFSKLNLKLSDTVLFYNAALTAITCKITLTNSSANNVLSLTQYGTFAWTATTADAALDTGLNRNAASKVEINNGTAGTLGDLTLRQLYPAFTNTSTVGAVTINKSCGQAIIGAAGTSVVVTNNLVTANSQVLATAAANDTTGYVKNTVAISGSFTINLVAAATANLPVNFLVLNQ